MFSSAVELAKKGFFMSEYVIQTKEMVRIVTLLHRVLKIGFTFFDLHGEEIAELDVPGRSPWCRKKRLDPAFDRACRDCDARHLDEARRLGLPYVYHCHAGLLEEIVPLYDRQGAYLGAIVVGQLHEGGDSGDGVRHITEAELRDIGDLLKYLSEYICENELVKRSARNWSAKLTEYLDAHWRENVTLAQLTRVTGKSVSFLSHNIPLQLGSPLKTYLRKKKMAQAQKLLAEGYRVGECADLLGFTDGFYFSREFRRFYGYPPREVRRLSSGGGSSGRLEGTSKN